MEKETKPSSSFMADFLTRAQAVCGGTADAPQLCEASSAGSRGCTGPRCWVHAGNTRAMGPRHGKGKAERWDMGRVAMDMPCMLFHARQPLQGGHVVPAEPRRPVSWLLNPCSQPEPPRTAQAQPGAAFPHFFPLPPSSPLHGPGVVSH